MNKPSLLLNSFLHSSIIINFTITFYDVYFPFVLPRRKIADSNFSRERKFGVEWGVRDDPTSHGCLAVSQSYSVYMPLGSRTAVTWVADRPPPTTWLILCAGRHHRRRAQTPGGRRDPRAPAAGSRRQSAPPAVPWRDSGIQIPRAQQQVKPYGLDRDNALRVTSAQTRQE
jgi:hypothetical protein